MSIDFSDKKKRSLATLYRAMPTAELAQRVAEGALAAPAQEAAQAELQRRLGPADPTPETLAAAARTAPPTDPFATAQGPEPQQQPEPASLSPLPHDARGRQQVWSKAALIILGTLLGLLFLPFHLWLLVALIALCWVIPVLGKTFPRAGMVLGIVFAVTPLALGGWAWSQGALTMRGGDFKPLGALLTWFALIFVSLLLWTLAGSLLFGARHRGSWRSLQGELDQMREEQIENLRR